MNNLNDINKKESQFFIWSEAEKRLLSELGNKMKPFLVKILEEFYDYIMGMDKLRKLVEEGGGRERLIKAQAAHWNSLFHEIDTEEFRQQTIAIGRAHDKIGLEPDWYLGGYQFLLKGFLSELRQLERNTNKRSDYIEVLLKAFFYDIDLSLSAYVEIGSTNLIKNEILTLSDMLEREATNTIGEVAHKAAKFNQISRQVSRRSTDLKTIVTDMATMTEQFSNDVRTIADLSSKLEDLSRSIGNQVGETSDATQAVSSLSQDAAEAVGRLNEATGQIAGVVSLIKDIASQTKMLSLNATIEAARAGQYGKGFAVVAQEVKGLAGQTENSITQVSTHSSDISEEAQKTTQNITSIGTSISQITAQALEINGAVDNQLNSTREISSLMDEAVDKAGAVAGRMQHISEQAEENLQSSMALSSISQLLTTDMETLKTRILGIVGTSTVKDDHIRVPVALDALMIDKGKEFPCKLVDLSLAGAMLSFQGTNPHEDIAMGSSIILRFDLLGDVSCRSLMPSDNLLHVQFIDLHERDTDRLKDYMDGVLENDNKKGKICSEAAAQIQSVFNKALKSGEIDLRTLMDESYVPIEGTEPEQFMTDCVSFTDRVLPLIQEKVMDENSDILLCCLTDRNGYIGTHNKKYSHPQKPGEVVWNTANCRNRRIFDDKAGLLAAHNKDAIFTQTYERDMGGGNIVYLKEVDCPVFVEDSKGKIHWGNLRVGYKA